MAVFGVELIAHDAAEHGSLACAHVSYDCNLVRGERVGVVVLVEGSKRGGKRERERRMLPTLFGRADREATAEASTSCPVNCAVREC